MADFGDWLHAQCARRNIALADVARATGIDIDHLAAIETGAAPPPGEKLIVAIANALQADPDDALAAAGQIASDIIECLLEQPGMRQMLRSVMVPLSDDRDRDRDR